LPTEKQYWQLLESLIVKIVYKIFEMITYKAMVKESILLQFAQFLPKIRIFPIKNTKFLNESLSLNVRLIAI